MSENRILLGSIGAAMAATAGAGLVLPEPAFGQSVGDRTLSDLKVERVGDCTTLTINFNIRVQLLSYFPTSGGRELHARIRPLDASAMATLNEALRTPASVPELRSIEYEGDNPAGPTLSLFFTHDMRFEIEAGAQPQQLVIRLAEPGRGPICAAPAAPPLPSPIVGAQMAIPAGLYAINVMSTPGEAGELNASQRAALGDRILYETEFERESQQWHRLRLGFFETREEAEAARARMAASFPDAWVVKVSADERAQGVANRIGGAPVQAAPSPPPVPAAGTEQDAANAAQLIGEAEQAIRDDQLDRAVQLLTNAAALPENPSTPRALELLGLTRERKGQLAHAQAEYEEYLRRYPTGEDADRVRQRLAAISTPSTGTPAAGPRLREASSQARSPSAWSWGTRGSFSQFYLRDQSTTKLPTTASDLGVETDNSVNVNQLLTSADISINGGNDRRQIVLRAAGSYTKNFGTSSSVTTINQGSTVTTVSSRPGAGVEALTALYLDYTDSALNSQLRIGRQTRNSAGVLGRFDGALLGWQARPQLRLNLVGGFPVLTSRQTHVLTDRYFYGASVDIGNKKSPLQTTVYWFDQHAKGGFVDRRSVGLETRYLKSRFNAYTIVDYDVKFSKLNLALLSLNYSLPDNSNFSLTADYRRSPLLTTTNALIGQIDTVTGLPIDSLRGLRPFFTDAQIYQLGLDRTLVAKSLTASYSRPLTKKLQANVDFTLTDTGGTPLTPASSGTNEVPALPAIGTEYYYGLQLVGSGLLWNNDIFILSGRYADTSTAKTYTVDFNARVPITSKFRLSPRARYGMRDSKPTLAFPTPGTFRQFQPTLRLNYYPIRHSEVEIEFGGNFSRQRTFNTTTSAWESTRESGWVLSAGYRLDF